MGTKLNTVIFDSKLISPEEISQKLIEKYNEIIRNLYIKNNKEVPDRLPSIGGSITLEFTKEHESGFQMFFYKFAERGSRPLLSMDNMAQELSLLIPNIPFIKLWYNSVVGTGATIVYKNGMAIDSTSSKEGDGAINIDPVFLKYFNIEKNSFDIIEDWFVKTYYHGQYQIGSYSYLKFINEMEPNDPLFYPEYLSIEKFKMNPNLSEAEWEDKLPSNEIDIPFEIAKSAYEGYLYALEGKYTSTTYQLTEGNLFAPGGVYLTDVPKLITPNEWFLFEHQCEQDLENRKTEKFGSKPPSYYLTKEELEILSYEEQKKEAYKRRVIAIRRFDYNSFSPDNFCYGIKPKCPVNINDYVKFNNIIGKVKSITFKASEEQETYIENINLTYKVPNKENTYGFASFTLNENYEIISDINLVPKDCLIEDKI